MYTGSIPVPASIKITNFVSVRKRLHELNAHLFKVVLWATEFIKKYYFYKVALFVKAVFTYFKNIDRSSTCISEV